MNLMDLMFKRCTEHNLKELTKVSWNTFYESYKDNNDPNNFRTFLDNKFNEERLLEELLNPNCHFYFLYDNSTLVGYFKLNEGNAQTEAFDEKTIELERIYVLKEFQGKGYGKMMIQKSIEISRDRNADFLWLGVWKINENAVRFYQREGFEIFGTHIYVVGNEDQEDWVMKYALT